MLTYCPTCQISSNASFGGQENLHLMESIYVQIRPKLEVFDKLLPLLRDGVFRKPISEANLTTALKTSYKKYACFTIKILAQTYTRKQ